MAWAPATDVAVGFRTGIGPSDADRLAQAHGLRPAGGLPALGVRRYRATTSATVAALRRDRRVRYVEPLRTVRVAEIPDDPRYDEQWGLQAIRAPGAWTTERGSFGAVVAVVDTGVDLDHPDLAGKLLPGIDVFEGDRIPQDENGHGTSVAGIAAASTDDAMGVAGVSWGSDILPVRALGPDGTGSDLDVAEGIAWAVDRGARVINLSLGGSEESLPLRDAVDYATAHGAVVVAATGNGGFSSLGYPASYEPTIAVGAVRQTRTGGLTVAWFSNHGPGIDLVAPGRSILAPVIDGWMRRDGTSFAAPFVSGAAALLLSRDPGLTPAALQERLRATAGDLGSAGYDTTYGAGVVDAAAAMAATPDAFPGDATAPAIAFPATRPGTAVRGLARVVVAASDPAEVVQLDLLREGRIRRWLHPAAAADATTLRTRFDWDTTRVPDGLRRWTARAVDAAGNDRTANLTVLVANEHALGRLRADIRTGTAGAARSVALRLPRRGPLVARVEGAADRPVTLSLVRADGRVLASRRGMGAAWLALAGLPAGSYRLRVATPGASQLVGLSAAWYR